MVWPPDSPWAPFWATNQQTARAMCRIAKIQKGTLVYDLGCGTGTAITVAAKEFGATCVGIEIDPSRFAIAWIKTRIVHHLSKQITLIRRNFFQVDFAPADVFFIYLIPNALKRLTPKFLKEVKKGALFISYVYEMPVELFEGRVQLIKHDQKQRIYVYKMMK